MASDAHKAEIAKRQAWALVLDAQKDARNAEVSAWIVRRNAADRLAEYRAKYDTFAAPAHPAPEKPADARKGWAK